MSNQTDDIHQRASELLKEAREIAKDFLGRTRRRTNEPSERLTEKAKARHESYAPTEKRKRRGREFYESDELDRNPIKTEKASQPDKPLTEAGEALLSTFEARREPASEQAKWQRKARAIKKSRVLAARENPNAFMEYCFEDDVSGKPIEQADIHTDFQNAMASGDDYVVEMPRDHGKTTQFEGHAVWRLGNNHNLRIKIVCESDSKAIERLFAITQHIRSNPRVHDVFPHLKPAQFGDWSKHKIVVNRDRIGMRDASIEAIGILSTATGGRGDLVFADDACGRRNTLEQPKLRETIKHAWDTDWTNLLEPDAQIIWTGTPWHTSDNTHKLKKNPTYKVLSRPVGDDRDPFKPVWSRKWSREQLKKRWLKIGQRAYDMGFRLRALSGDVVVIDPDWIRYWDVQPDLARLQVFMAFDQSSGEGKDFFACVVVGVDAEAGLFFVLDAWHAKLTFLGRAESIERNSQLWMPHMLGLEQSSLKSLSQYLTETTLTRFLPLRPHLSKMIRLSEVTPWLERGQVLFNPALDPERIIDPEGHGDVVSELKEFPLAANDDLVDAFVHAMNLASAYTGVEEANVVGLNVHSFGGDGLIEDEDDDDGVFVIGSSS